MVPLFISRFVESLSTEQVPLFAPILHNAHSQIEYGRVWALLWIQLALSSSKCQREVVNIILNSRSCKRICMSNQAL
jgi:hypothetical protein